MAACTAYEGYTPFLDREGVLPAPQLPGIALLFRSIEQAKHRHGREEAADAWSTPDAGTPYHCHGHELWWTWEDLCTPLPACLSSHNLISTISAQPGHPQNFVLNLLEERWGVVQDERSQPAPSSLGS